MIINEEVRVSDFAFEIFQKIRTLDGITKKQILESLDPSRNLIQLLKSGESKGKSGSFFFFSHDNKFIIKSMFEQEQDILMEHLKDYEKHLTLYPDSLIARIYGIF